MVLWGFGEMELGSSVIFMFLCSIVLLMYFHYLPFCLHGDVLSQKTEPRLTQGSFQG